MVKQPFVEWMEMVMFNHFLLVKIWFVIQLIANHLFQGMAIRSLCIVFFLEYKAACLLCRSETSGTTCMYIYIYVGVIGYVRGQPDVPLPTYPYGKSLYKPYIVGIYGKSSPRIPREHTKYHGYTVRGTPNYPLNMIGTSTDSKAAILHLETLFFANVLSYDVCECKLIRLRV